MTDTDFPDMGAPIYHFYRTGFENCRKASIVRDDPEGGDPHIIAVLGRIYDPDRLQDLVDAKNREIFAANPIRASGTRPTGEPGVTSPPAPEASGPVGRGVAEGELP